MMQEKIWICKSLRFTISVASQRAYKKEHAASQSCFIKLRVNLLLGGHFTMFHCFKITQLLLSKCSQVVTCYSLFLFYIFLRIG
ncbi:hypothetical protein RIR_e53252_A0A2N1M9R7_9GLOM [Rhizophagus irregularis DAOM 181602=DAOM 197198]|nr:hypothetical protein RIR_e53252_A0A2N1M9R7_9GLOM [Rhizophagus irregularis DAOM 181602=DAOM 197198]